MRRNSKTLIIATVMSCYFIAAFTALGMPPFFSLIINKSFHYDSFGVAGWLYVVPIVFTALSSPLWGRLADKFGKKTLLLRAQLGLTTSFLLAGFSTKIEVFVIALMLQGLFGGTLSASNAYLATLFQGTDLTRSLTLMQWAGRAALVVAPIGFGILIMQVSSPVELYRYMALMPLTAALFIACLPQKLEMYTSTRTQVEKQKSYQITPSVIYAAQFVFFFSKVLITVYFVSFVQLSTLSINSAIAGVLFALPHVVYLLFAMPLERLLERVDPVYALSFAFLLFSATLFGQALFASILTISMLRVLMGLAISICYISLNALMSSIVRSHDSGIRFGWFESTSKWGAVMGGVAAGLTVHYFDLKAPFFLGAFILLLTSFFLYSLMHARGLYANK